MTGTHRGYIHAVRPAALAVTGQAVTIGPLARNFVIWFTENRKFII